MKKVLLGLIGVVALNAVAFAQFTKFKLEEIEKLKNGTVVVAISDFDETNKAAAEIMKACWTASKFEMIKKSELNAYLKANPENYVLTYLMDNGSNSFGMTNTTSAGGKTTNTTTMHQTRAVGDGLVLTKNLKKLRRLDPGDAMVYCFIDSKLDMIDEKAEFMRQLGAVNAILTFPNLQQNQVGGWKIATLNQKEVIKKELWISDEDLNKKGADEAKMKSTYNPYKYKIVTKEEIAKAIIEKRKDIVYLAVAEYQAGLNMFLIHSPEDNRVLFFMGGSYGFDPKALEKIKENKQYGQ